LSNSSDFQFENEGSDSYVTYFLLK